MYTIQSDIAVCILHGYRDVSWIQIQYLIKQCKPLKSPGLITIMGSLMMRVALLWTLLCWVRAFDVPKVLWAYWNEDLQSAPLVTRMCVENIQHYLNNTDWKLVIINQHTIPDYVGNMSRFYHLMNNSRVQITMQKQADYLRLTLIQEHGGVWMDINTMLVGDMGWLQQIQANTQVINKHGQSPETVLFELPIYGGWNEVVLSEGEQVHISPGHEIWFLAAMPKSLLITAWLDEFEASLLRGYEQTILKSAEEGIRLSNEKDIYLMGNMAIQQVIQSKQLQLDREWAAGNASERQFAVHYYRVWTFDSQKSAFAAPAISNFDTYQSARLLMQFTEEELHPYMGKPKYFIKLVGEWYKRINSVFSHYKIDAKQRDIHALRNQALLIFNPEFEQNDSQIGNYKQRLICPDRIMPHYFFVKGSLVDNYLLRLTKLQYNVTMYDKDQIKRDCYNDVATALIKEALAVIISFSTLLRFCVAYLLSKCCSMWIRWRNNRELTGI